VRTDVAIDVQQLGIKFDLGLTRSRTFRRTIDHVLRRRDEQGEFWALRNVSFQVDAGETLGVIGQNGSGKSTLLLAVAGILRPDMGFIETSGRSSTLLTVGAGFEPDLTGRQNIYLNGAYLGFPRATIDERLDEIVEFSDLGEFIDAPLRKYSSGMRARLGFSIAAHVEPEILLLDEVLGVGDAAFRRKSKAKLGELIQRARAIVVVSHSMGFVADTCDRVLWLDRGNAAAFGDPHEVIERYVSETEARKGPLRAVSTL
jgi:ABC-type polysaccharide/polyol phosphate transport system ATPase subunit